MNGQENALTKNSPHQFVDYENEGDMGYLEKEDDIISNHSNYGTV